MILVTEAQLMALQVLSLECHSFLEKETFDEQRWEAGLRGILGSSVVDELKRMKQILPGASFPVKVRPAGPEPA
jgi:hypothetical protein